MVPNLRALQRATCCCRVLQQQEVLPKTWRFLPFSFFFLFSTLGLQLIQRRPLGGTLASPSFWLGPSRCCFSCRWCRVSGGGSRPFNNAAIVQRLRCSDPSVLFPRLPPPSSGYLPFGSSRPHRLSHPSLPLHPSILPSIISLSPPPAERGTLRHKHPLFLQTLSLSFSPPSV